MRQRRIINTHVVVGLRCDYVVAHYTAEITSHSHPLIRDDGMVVDFLMTIRESVAALMVEARS
jgi:hypothetical protein